MAVINCTLLISTCSNNCLIEYFEYTYLCVLAMGVYLNVHTHVFMPGFCASMPLYMIIFTWGLNNYKQERSPHNIFLIPHCPHH